jgi:hypothetical protein
VSFIRFSRVTKEESSDTQIYVEVVSRNDHVIPLRTKIQDRNYKNHTAIGGRCAREKCVVVARLKEKQNASLGSLDRFKPIKIRRDGKKTFSSEISGDFLVGTA